MKIALDPLNNFSLLKAVGEELDQWVDMCQQPCVVALFGMNIGSNPDVEAQYFLAYNVRIELARHLHMRELSEYLLGSISVESSGSSNNDEDDKGSSRKKKKSKMVPLLRIPTFERWCIDSKTEERTKRQK